MKLPKLDPANPQSVAAALRGFFEGTLESYNGLLDKVPDSLRPTIQGLKDKVDSVLAGMASQPTTQVPAAQEASYAIQSLCYAMTAMQEMVDRATGALNKVMGEFTPQVQTLNALNGRLQSGELLEKKVSEDLVKQAVTQARKEERDRAALLAKRRSTLMGLNLPAPAADETIEGEETAFTALQTEATRRDGELNKLGVKQTLNSVELSKLLYGPKDDFESTLKLLAKVSSGKGAGSEKEEPLAGATGDAKVVKFAF